MVGLSQINKNYFVVIIVLFLLLNTHNFNYQNGIRDDIGESASNADSPKINLLNLANQYGNNQYENPSQIQNLIIDGNLQIIHGQIIQSKSSESSIGKLFSMNLISLNMVSEDGELTPGVGTMDLLLNPSDTDLWKISVPFGKESLRFVLDGPVDADFNFYVKYDSEPTVSDYDFKGTTSGG